ncbi:hypothetical protein BLS_005940 [Venturia inaequalis]|uniref:Uncharacterized protein n=1 Tax=Venturia inaequalis TaxID=5025 RepID=A0A8H3UEZ9_VENIN|nr:hypothetical protein EG327_011290 [Venturia inaequalis]KAE9968302.1 hypothetical protein BLS_005940 [Venturia inaequalis]RDI80032.1 hypothetical protein Vi05172_g10001 [Venturia inaequalis]
MGARDTDRHDGGERNWLWRGFQSAVFFYVSCGPCFERSRRRKKLKEAKASQRARANDGSAMNLQPAPFETNPHWNEEMALGPSPPSRRATKADTFASRGITTAGTVTSQYSTAGSSLSDLGPAQSVSSVHLPGHSWNTKRYQRADEEFVYVPDLEEVGDRPPTHRQMSDNSRKGSSVGVAGWPAEPLEKPSSLYYMPARAPPVNDLHPPVVSTVPAKKEERAWMKEPPPSASFMNGKKGVTARSRSGSGTSGNSSLRTMDRSLGRQVGHKMVEDKVKRGVTPSVDGEPSQPHRKSTATVPTGRSSPIKGRGSSSLDVDDLERTPSKRKKRPPPVQIPIFDSLSHVDDSSSSSPDVLRATTKGNHHKSPAVSANLHSTTAGRPTLGTKSGSPERSMPRKSKDTSPIPVSSSTLSPPEFSTAPTTPSPKCASSRSPGLHVGCGNGEVVDEYTPSPRKPKQRKDTKMDFEDDSDYDAAMYAEEMRAQAMNELRVKDSSLRTLQDQVEMRALQGNKFIQSPIIEARMPLPKDSLEVDGSSLGERRRWSLDL